MPFYRVEAKNKRYTRLLEVWTDTREEATGAFRELQQNGLPPEEEEEEDLWELTRWEVEEQYQRTLEEYREGGSVGDPPRRQPLPQTMGLQLRRRGRP